MINYKRYAFFALICTTLMSITTSCSRKREEVWDDTSSCYRHMSRGFRSLCGDPCTGSRQVRHRNEFYCPEDDCCTSFDLQPCNDPRPVPQSYGYQNQYVAPYEDVCCEDELAMADYVARPPKESPGDPGSPIPGISAFKDPSSDSRLKSIFKNVYFPYNSNLIKGQENLASVQAVANYMKSRPGVYIFVEGHCDERGAEAYNLALGARRANAVRNMLIEYGVNADNIFTISYGTERPIDSTHTEQGWSLNRRAEFKVYER